VIGDCSADRSREDVHQSKEGTEDSGCSQSHVELIEEVLDNDVVHCKLNSEAVTIGNGQNPHSVIPHSQQEHVASLGLGHLTRFMELSVSSIWQVLSKEEHDEADQDVHATRDEERPTPSQERLLVLFYP